MTINNDAISYTCMFGDLSKIYRRREFITPVKINFFFILFFFSRSGIGSFGSLINTRGFTQEISTRPMSRQ